MLQQLQHLAPKQRAPKKPRARKERRPVVADKVASHPGPHGGVAFLRRILAVMAAIPEEPQSITTDSLHLALGRRTSLRTVQRDVLMLARVVTLVRNSRSKPHGWSWPRGAKPINGGAL